MARVLGVLVLLGACCTMGGCSGQKAPTPQQSEAIEKSIQDMQEQAYGKTGEPPPPPRQ